MRENAPVCKLQPNEEDTNRMIVLARNFMYSVYLRGLRDFIENSGEFGLLAEFEDITISSKKTTMKFIFKLSNGDFSVSFICNEDDNPRMRIKEFEGSLEQLNELVDKSILLIKESKDTFFDSFKKCNYSTL